MAGDLTHRCCLFFGAVYRLSWETEVCQFTVLVMDHGISGRPLMLSDNGLQWRIKTVTWDSLLTHAPQALESTRMPVHVLRCSSCRSFSSLSWVPHLGFRVNVNDCYVHHNHSVTYKQRTRNISFRTKNVLRAPEVHGGRRTVLITTNGIVCWCSPFSDCSLHCSTDSTVRLIP